MMPPRTGARYLLASTLLAFAIVIAPAPQAAQAQPAAGSVEQRLDRVERLLESNALLRMLEDVETLKQELRDLRGEIELQSHSVNQIQQHQRELYLDVDRRLQQVETVGGSPTSLAGSTSTGAASAAAGTPAATPGNARPLPTPPAASGAAPSVAPAPTTFAAVPPAQSPTAAPASPADAAREQQAYQDAFNLLKAGRYDQASKAFQAFLRDYPGGQFTDNAQYWLGETYYVTRQFELAMEEFQTLTREHPESQKQTHALLKMGYIYDELGQSADARRVLEDLVNRYPQTTAAALARKRLQRLRSE